MMTGTRRFCPTRADEVAPDTDVADDAALEATGTDEELVSR